MPRKKKPKKIAINGLVTPEDWDESDRPTHVSLITDDYEKYDVMDDAVGRELFDYPYENVRAFGIVEVDALGDKLIRVLDFSPQDDEGEEIWDDVP